MSNWLSPSRGNSRQPFPFVSTQPWLSRIAAAWAVLYAYFGSVPLYQNVFAGLTVPSAITP